MVSSLQTRVWVRFTNGKSIILLLNNQFSYLELSFSYLSGYEVLRKWFNFFYYNNWINRNQTQVRTGSRIVFRPWSFSGRGVMYFYCGFDALLKGIILKIFSFVVITKLKIK